MDSISQARLAQVHPVLQERVTALLEKLAPLDIRIAAGLRTVAEENALWQIGRDAEGNKIRGEATVTNAKGTQSLHVLGFAVDLVVLNAQGECDWNDQPWIPIAAQFSLRSGAEWGDKPHLELIEIPSMPTAEMQQIYLAAGVEALWKELSAQCILPT